LPGEVLPRCQKSLNQECGLDEVAAIVVVSKAGNDFSGAAIQEMWEHTVETIGLPQKAGDLEHPIDALLTGYEAALDSDQ
jgi:hypothetical protein